MNKSSRNRSAVRSVIIAIRVFGSPMYLILLPYLKDSFNFSTPLVSSVRHAIDYYKGTGDKMEAYYIKQLDVLMRRKTFSGGKLMPKDQGAYDYIMGYLGAVRQLEDDYEVEHMIVRLRAEMPASFKGAVK